MCMNNIVNIKSLMLIHCYDNENITSEDTNEISLYLLIVTINAKFVLNIV